MKGLFFLCVPLLLNFFPPTNADNPFYDEDAPATIVKVHLDGLGTVQGVRSMGMEFFGGIPYAAPPVGNLRWAPPEEPPSWKPHSLDATQFGPDCYQINDPIANPQADLSQMSEDCLYLNVYSPAGASRSKQKLPVMVWFHGGAFQQGSAKRPEFDARRIAEEEMVVVVTVNYRLGSLGFLVSSELGLLGNYGLMDQRAALYFIQRHVSKFGGNPDSTTLFGESAGAVMIGLHLQMHNPGLFHRAILQSNPMGYQFRSVVVADFLGDALRRSVDCKDLQCLRSEPVEEIMRAQSSLMGIPRSVGDFFAWGPTLTHQKQVTLQGRKRYDMKLEHRSLFSVENYAKQRESTKFAVNVTQPMQNLHLVPDEIPIIIGTNKHEGEMFVHSAFPLTMSKAVYWMFVGALFKDSASRVLRHYRPYVSQLEREAKTIADIQIQEEKNKQFFDENKEQLEFDFRSLLPHNFSTSDMASPETIEKIVQAFSSGGGDEGSPPDISSFNQARTLFRRLLPQKPDNETLEEQRLLREERIKNRTRTRALKQAAKVVVDYRPVMSQVINDYLFRCPSWHYAHLLSRNRKQKQKTNNVYVYRFSQPTHIPGYTECWGKACHTAELPYVFQAMEVIRSNYSTLSEIAQREAPVPPLYPYTDIMNTYRGIFTGDGVADSPSEDFENALNNVSPPSANHTRSFKRILKHFFDDYFGVDADEETASDMAKRWMAFARSGDPNYEGARVEWVPWRFIPKEERKGIRNLEDDPSFDRQDYYDIWNDIEQESTLELDQNETDLFSWKEDKIGRAYRRRALQALDMKVVEEDELRTELKRTKGNERDPDNPFFGFLSKLGVSYKVDAGEGQLPIETIRHIQRIAQDMGVLGTGLRIEDRKGETRSYWDDDFFPQLLEIQWPPEGRLVERDCTCDFWEKVRYRY